MPIIDLSSKEVAYLAERDFRLRHLMKHIGNLEYSRPESAFHSLAHSIIEQMLSMRVGQLIESRLRDLCGGEYTPERIVSTPVEDIKACGVSFRKAQSLQKLAEYALSNNLEALAELSDEEIHKSLIKLPGIGKWTCDMFLLFYLERPDVLPVEDGAFRQSFEWLYEASPSSPEVQKVICSLWNPYSSTAARYLYRALNNGVVQKSRSSSLLWT